MPVDARRPTSMDRYSVGVSISVDDLRSLAARVRAEAEAAGELTLSGPTHWHLPEAARAALIDYAASGAYEAAAQASIAEDPDVVEG